MVIYVNAVSMMNSSCAKIVAHYGNNLRATTKRIYDEFEVVYMKHDGSLSAAGFEIVSHPATIEYHTSELKKPDNWDEVIRQWQNDEITAKKAMALLGMKKSTFYVLLKSES